LSQGRTLLNGSRVYRPKNSERGSISERERAMAIFEAANRNNIMIAVALVAIAVIALLYAAGWLPGIF
jgi:hypothetical protein